jgi:hypothetical protein
MVLFETPEAEDLLASSYVALLKQVSDSDRQRRAWYSQTVRATCRVLSVQGSGTGGVLGVVRIQGAKARQSDIQACLTQHILPLLGAFSSIGSVSVLCNDPDIRQRMDQVRVTGHQDGHTDWVVLMEAGLERDVRHAWKAMDQSSAWQNLQLGDAVIHDLYRLLYVMVQSSPAQ